MHSELIMTSIISDHNYNDSNSIKNCTINTTSNTTATTRLSQKGMLIDDKIRKCIKNDSNNNNNNVVVLPCILQDLFGIDYIPYPHNNNNNNNNNNTDRNDQDDSRSLIITATTPDEIMNNNRNNDEYKAAVTTVSINHNNHQLNNNINSDNNNSSSKVNNSNSNEDKTNNSMNNDNNYYDEYSESIHNHYQEEDIVSHSHNNNNNNNIDILKIVNYNDDDGNNDDHSITIIQNDHSSESMSEQYSVLSSPPIIETTSNDNDSNNRKSNSNKRKTPRRLKKIMKGIKRRVSLTPRNNNNSNSNKSIMIKNEALVNNQEEYNHNEDVFVDNDNNTNTFFPQQQEEKVTPKRSGKKIGDTNGNNNNKTKLTDNNTSTTTDGLLLLETLQNQHEQLIQHQKHLNNVQNETIQVYTRAKVIEDNINTIQNDIIRLQKLLQESIQKLQIENSNLQSTQERLHELEKETENAMFLMEQSLREMRLYHHGEGERKDFFNNQDRMKDEYDNDPIITMNNNRRRILSTSENLNSILETPPFDVITENNTNNITEESNVPDVEPIVQQRRRAHTLPQERLSSFMRVNDLSVADREYTTTTSTMSLSSSYYSRQESLEQHTPLPQNKDLAGSIEDFFFIDNDIALILNQLYQLGYDVVTDESDRFTPTRETQRILDRQNKSGKKINNYDDNNNAELWPINPWYTPTGKDVLTWTGYVDHDGFGHDWPIVKARGIIKTSSNVLLNLLLDSKQIKSYNKISQGRDDVMIIQDGIHTTIDDSMYGFPGDAKIVRALVKPKLLPKTIEMLSLWYTKPIDNISNNNSYMIVSRSIWEDDTGNHLLYNTNAENNNNNNILRSEMLLGVQLIRPIIIDNNNNNDYCELTTITHVFSPGVPEIMAKRMAPSNATNMIREIQSLFQ